MAKISMKNKVQLSNEELKNVSGGFQGSRNPLYPNVPRPIYIPDIYKDDEPKDGGATGSW